MKMKLGVIMDPISGIQIYKDSTFAILLEAQKRDYDIFYMEQKDVFAKNGRCFAQMTALKVQDNAKNWFAFGKQNTLPLDELDCILMRKDPPVNKFFIYTAQLLELAEKRGVLVVNKPESLIAYNEKLFINWFPECIAPTLISPSKTPLKEFIAEQNDVILKPLDGMGGKGIFKINAKDANLNVILETLTRNYSLPIMAQKYIQAICAGDKRILMINGDPYPYALARLAPLNEIRANLAAGGTGVGQPLSEQDLKICQKVSSVLKEKGLLFVGLDVIGEYLTEVNITSPTCIRELDQQFNTNISARLLDCLEEKVSLRKKGDLHA